MSRLISWLSVALVIPLLVGCDPPDRDVQGRLVGDNGGGDQGDGGEGQSSPATGWETKATRVLTFEQAKLLVPGSLKVSPDGRHFAYALNEGYEGTEKITVVVDGRERLPLVIRIGAESFSPSSWTPDLLSFTSHGDHYMVLASYYPPFGSGYYEQGYDSSRTVVYLDGSEHARFWLGVGQAGPGETTQQGAPSQAWLTDDGIPRYWRNDAIDGKPLTNGPVSLPYGNDNTSLQHVLARDAVHWAVVGREYLEVNGKMAAPPEGGVFDFRLSANGQGYAYFSSQDNQQFAVVNGTPQKRFDAIHPAVGGYGDSATSDSATTDVHRLRLSADGKHYAHLGTIDGASYVLYDNARHKLPGAPKGTVSLSPDGTRWACMVRLPADATTGQTPLAAIVDGKPGKKYVSGDQSYGVPEESTAYLIVFSPTGREVAYAAIVEVRRKNPDDPDGPPIVEHHPAMVRNGKEQKHFFWVSPEPFFSPDGKRLAYLASKMEGDGRFLAVDGEPRSKPYETYHDVGVPSFSRDSQNVGFVARSEGEWHAVLNGQERKAYEAIGPEGTRVGFTTDGRYTYFALKDGGDLYWVEERPTGRKYAEPKPYKQKTAPANRAAQNADRPAADSEPAQASTSRPIAGGGESEREFAGNRYQVITEQLSWHAAKTACEKRGGRLAVVTSAEQNEFLTKLVLDAGLKEAWLGATDEDSEGEWRWTDSTRAEYTNWGPSQPNNTAAEEHYLLLWAVNGGVWSDQPDVSVKHAPGYVCETTTSRR